MKWSLCFWRVGYTDGTNWFAFMHAPPPTRHQHCHWRDVLVARIDGVCSVAMSNDARGRPGLYLRRMHPNQMWWRPAPMNASGRLPLSKFLASSYVPVTGHACSLVHVLHTRLNCVHDSTHGRVDCGPLRRATPIQNVQSFEYPPVHTHPSNKEAEAWD